jgi:soluble lytic murein transglycosylase-like protein
MRIVATAALLLAVLLPDCCRAASLVDRYAVAVRAFNPALDDASARVLAERLLAVADREGIDARLAVALVAIESGWQTEAVSSAGALGLGQLMPGTARGLGVDPRDPIANIEGTVHHLAWLLRAYAARGPDAYPLALGAYNAGAGAVARYGGIPPYPETQAYVRAVLALWRRLAGF